MDLLEAILTLMRRRRLVLPHPELLRSLVRYYGLPGDPNELLVQVVRRRKVAWTEDEEPAAARAMGPSEGDGVSDP